MEEKIPIANEMSTSQRPAIEVLQKLGYKYISEEENKKDSPDKWESLKSELMQLSDDAIDELHKYVKYLLWLEEQD